jgi:hypothetical protein
MGKFEVIVYCYVKYYDLSYILDLSFKFKHKS